MSEPMHKISRHIVLLAKGWYPHLPEHDVVEELKMFQSAWAGCDLSYYSSHSVLSTVLMVLEDVGSLRKFVSSTKLMLFNSILSKDPHAATINEMIETIMSSFGVMSVDDFDFDLGDPDPRIVKEMQDMIDEKAKAATR